jgi:hypothetical protein
MASIHRVSGFVLILIVVTSLGFTAQGCWWQEAIAIDFENRTDTPIIVEVDGKDPLSIEPMSSKGLTYPHRDNYHIVARTLDGNIVFSEWLTDDELIDRNKRIVID